MCLNGPLLEDEDEDINESDGLDHSADRGGEDGESNEHIMYMTAARPVIFEEPISGASIRASAEVRRAATGSLNLARRIYGTAAQIHRTTARGSGGVSAGTYGYVPTTANGDVSSDE